MAVANWGRAKERSEMNKLILGLAAVALAGCGSGIETDYSHLDLVNVSGTVTYDGKPLPEALVTFEAEDGTFSYGMTDESGHYKLMFNSEKSGVLTGPKTVRIETGVPISDEEGGGEGDVERPRPTVNVPAAYNSQSKLKVTVESSDTINFDLKSDGSTTGAS